MCDLLRPTGYSAEGRRPAGYPETLFARVSLPAGLASRLVGRLRSEDLYSLLPHYPEPRERSTALATQVEDQLYDRLQHVLQAGMLVVLLYFQPAVLKTEKALMREIVDKYFCDNWVVSVYMGRYD